MRLDYYKVSILTLFIIDSEDIIEDHEIWSEEVLFKTFVIYMIYLSFLKRKDFYPEHSMRIKLFWDCSKESEKALQSNQSWMWIYGIKSSQIKETVTKLTKTMKERYLI